MADKMVHVFVDLDGVANHVGQLWAHSSKGKDRASFKYDEAWLNNPDRFAIEPALTLDTGSFHTDGSRNIFGAIGDSSPDRWGRMLIRRAAMHHAKTNDEKTRTLNEIDYLLAVNDTLRQGALRFKEEIPGPFLSKATTTSIPPLIDLPKLLSATQNVINDDESDEDLKILLAPGGSLGGARPKASVVDQTGQLMIAKFPRIDDHFNTVLWEAVALTLAANAKINVPQWRIEIVNNKPIILINRFDRIGNKRIPFISAMSMIGAKDNEQHSYLELVDALKQYGSHPKQNIIELWRRIVFSILISNTDDHLRNHGFIYELQRGWQLSPIYDVNPTPDDIKARFLTTNIDLDDNTASLELAFSVIHEFGIQISEARSIAKEVGMAVSKWSNIAKDLGIKKSEIVSMASAFDHEDLQLACKLV